MSKLKVLDLFAGVGGFSLGLERTGGFETVAFCEIEDYPRRVLAKHWPNVPIYDDVRELTGDRLRADGISVDVITGGFPCQDISTAGRQAGIGEGTRSGLWTECARLLRDIRPRYAIFENVTALLSGNGGDWFKRVLWDISQVGFDAEWHCIPASYIGARHRRDRVWIISHSRHMQRRGRKKREAKGHGQSCVYGQNGFLANAIGGRQQGPGQSVEPLNTEAVADWEAGKLVNGCIGDVWQAEPGVGRVANGVPKASHRLGCLGNAVVPQIPELIGRAILEAENAA